MTVAPMKPATDDSKLFQGYCHDISQQGAHQVGVCRTAAAFVHRFLVVEIRWSNGDGIWR